MGFKKAASAQQANYSCSKCGEKFTEGKEIFMQKKDDGTWFSCHNLECFKSQGGTVEEKKSFGSSKFPIGDAPRVYEMAEVLLGEFKKTRNSDQDTKLTTAEELQAVTSFFDSLSGGFKP